MQKSKELKIDGISSFACDPGVVTAAYVAEQMNLPSPGPYESICILQNKGLFREFLAKKHGAEFTCPLTAGIFISLAAQASEEREDNKIPFWRTLKKDGELNPKYPGGVEYQKEMLEYEGHSFITKGRKNIRYFVEDYEDKLFELE